MICNHPRIANVFAGTGCAAPNGGCITDGRHTGLLGEAPGGVWRVFSRAGINVEHEKKVNLGV